MSRDQTKIKEGSANAATEKKPTNMAATAVPFLRTAAAGGQARLPGPSVCPKVTEANF